jgi:hypothetical protein
MATMNEIHGLVKASSPRSFLAMVAIASPAASHL